MEEVFKDIKGFPNYEVSNLGRVWSKERVTKQVFKDGTSRNRNLSGKFIKVHQTSDSIPCVYIADETGKATTVNVRSLVAWAFLEEEPKGRRVIQIDGKKLNFNPSNLKYADEKEVENTAIPVTKEMQHTWDMCLLNGWKENLQIFRAIKSFCLIENSAIVFSNKTDPIFLQWFDRLELKRKPAGHMTFTPIKIFIGRHSIKLSSYLYSGGDVNKALEVIDNFRWTTKPSRHEKDYEGGKKPGNFIISARLHTGNRLWR